MLCKKSLLAKVNPAKRFKKFEYIDNLIKSSSKSLRLVVFYHTPPSKKNGSTNGLFFEEFGPILEQLATEKGQIMIVGDFNFHIDNHINASAVKFIELLQTFDHTQRVKQTTREGNQILDFIITKSEYSIVRHISVIDPVLSDHYAVRCKVLLPKPPLQKKGTAYRSPKCIDFARFREDIKNLDLLDNDIVSIADLVDAYNAKLASLLDDKAPARNKVVTLRPKSPWFTPEIREQKLKRRRLERR